MNKMNTQNLILLVVATLAISAHSSKIWTLENHHEYTIEHYMVQFNRVYADENEFLMRKTLFDENMKKINDINNDKTMTWKAGVNHMTDLLPEELQAKRGYKLITPKSSKTATPFRNLRSKSFDDFPKSVDWREKGVVNPVKNQGGCGSCWAFATISVLESHAAINSGKLLNLSEQQVVDCTPNPHHCGGTGGCEGADAPLGFEYLRATGGASLTADYPYHQRDETCKDQDVEKVVSLDGFHLIPDNDPYALTEALVNRGPISVTVDASNWHLYHSGILNGFQGAETNHGVVLVGYGEDADGKYWIIRNSWGPAYGEDGYIRVHREDSPLDVVCYVNNNPAVGNACDNGPTQLYICGTSGLYYGSTFPVGARAN
mmetsp:Transcript_31401/g.32584  ORF Transcript_31401/g.32584 Transcript_31401/m.32584 type:complete len:374 (+) Transcript_31401:3-1124(+)